jgi:glycerol-1-phosphatase
MSDGEVSLNGWRSDLTGGELKVLGEGSASDWWRVAVTAAWHHLDQTGSPVSIAHTRPPQPVDSLSAR